MQYLNPDQEVRRIDFISSIKSFHKVCNQSSCIIRIEDFFKTLRISDAGIEERSITWLELYILYRISGHPRPLDSKPQSIGDRAKPSIPLDLQFNHFKKQTRRIADRALFGGRDAHIFKPVQILEDNLVGVGIQGKHPAVGFNISLNEHIQSQVNKSLILLGRNVSQAKLTQIISHECAAPYVLSPLSFKGKVGWDSRLDSYHGNLEQVHVSHSTVEQSSDTTNAVNTRRMYVVQCPACVKQSSSHSYKFQYKDLDAKIKCTECSKFTAIKYWKCNCGELWHTCKVHFCTVKVEPVVKVKLRSTSKSEGSGKASSKRMLSNASFNELLDDDLRTQAKRAKQLDGDDKMDDIVVPPRAPNQLRASMLPISLREKFGYLFSS